MDWKHIEDDWHRMKFKVQERWGHLTEDDLEQAGGDRDALNVKIQDRYGLKEEHARLQLDEWFNNQQWLS
ncbi:MULTISPECIES: CsbD family protein [unclassified Ochrobactrum]|uniref:CsbD family protein n=1 Tax=unclassified Ochrobactrum TaxID=239106 RepID=UPI0030A8F36A